MHLILLHGAIGAMDQLKPLADTLSTDYKIHRFNFYGHGDQEMPASPFSIPLFAQQLSDYIGANIPTGELIHIFGYSMGGYVALYLAKHQPQKFSKLITLGTKFHWDITTAEKEVKMLDSATIQTKLPEFAAQLQNRHKSGWENVLSKTAEMMLQLGLASPNSPLVLKAADLALISNPVLILLGDRDKMVSIDETISVHQALPNAQLGILPATQHPIERVDQNFLSTIIRRFLS